jgi:hypothetical protein
MAGKVVTFYSYKGGVGRSFALANIAVILAEWGSRVLVVDWDIEAPGLNHYFAEHTPRLGPGVLDFLKDCQQSAPLPWDAYTSEVTLPNVAGTLRIMPAAAGGGSDYTSLVQKLDWDELYEERALGARLEELRAAWIDNFDLILIDSRTGITDFSGLTTAQLPDILAFLFTANDQSLTGCANVARRAMDARRKMPIDRPALLPLPIPGRFEQREEYDRALFWRSKFVTELSPFLATWAHRDIDPLKLIDLLTIPYVPRWTFGEELAALLEPSGSTGTRTPGQAASYACETIAALLRHAFARVDLLVSSRDEYVHSARAASQDKRSVARDAINLYISYAHEDRDSESILTYVMRVLELGSKGRIHFIDVDTTGKGSGNITNKIQSEIEKADAYAIVMGESSSKSKWQQLEIDLLLRQNLRSSLTKPILPIVLPGGEKAFYLSRLADYQAVQFDPNANVDAQYEHVFARIIDRLQSLKSQKGRVVP